MSVLKQLEEAQRLVNSTLVKITEEQSILAEHGFNNVTELLAAHNVLKRRLEDKEMAEEAYKRFMKSQEPTLANISKALNVKLNDVREVLAKGRWDVRQYNDYYLKPEQLAYLVMNFKEN